MRIYPLKMECEGHHACRNALTRSISLFEMQQHSAELISENGWVEAFRQAIVAAKSAHRVDAPEDILEWACIASEFLHPAEDAMGKRTEGRSDLDRDTLNAWRSALDALHHERGDGMIEHLECVILEGPLKDAALDRSLLIDWIGGAMQMQRLDVLALTGKDCNMVRGAMEVAKPLLEDGRAAIFSDKHLNNYPNVDKKRIDQLDTLPSNLFLEWVSDPAIDAQTLIAIAEHAQINPTQSVNSLGENWMNCIDDARFDAMLEKFDPLHASRPIKDRIEAFSALGPSVARWWGNDAIGFMHAIYPGKLGTRALQHARQQWLTWTHEEQRIAFDQWILQALLHSHPLEPFRFTHWHPEDPSSHFSKAFSYVMEWKGTHRVGEYCNNWLEKFTFGEVNGPSFYNAIDETNRSYISMSCRANLISHKFPRHNSKFVKMQGDYKRREPLSAHEEKWLFLHFLGSCISESQGKYHRFDMPTREDGKILAEMAQETLECLAAREKIKINQNNISNSAMAVSVLLHEYEQKGALLSHDAWMGFAPFINQLQELLVQTSNVCWQSIVNHLSNPLDHDVSFLAARLQCRMMIVALTNYRPSDKNSEVSEQMVNRLHDLFMLYEHMGPRDEAPWAKKQWDLIITHKPELINSYEAARLSAQTIMTDDHPSSSRRL